MPISIIVPEGFIPIRRYAEKHMIPEPRVRAWIRMDLLETTSVGKTDGRKWFVKDVPPPVKLHKPYDPHCPEGHIPLTMWMLREKVSWHAVKKKIEQRELRIVEVVDKSGKVWRYISHVQRWRWTHGRGSIKYMHKANPVEETCTS